MNAQFSTLKDRSPISVKYRENPQKFRYYKRPFFFERRANRERLAA